MTEVEKEVVDDSGPGGRARKCAGFTLPSLRPLALHSPDDRADARLMRRSVPLLCFRVRCVCVFFPCVCTTGAANLARLTSRTQPFARNQTR